MRRSLPGLVHTVNNSRRRGSRRSRRNSARLAQLARLRVIGTCRVDGAGVAARGVTDGARRADPLDGAWVVVVVLEGAVPGAAAAAWGSGEAWLVSPRTSAMVPAPVALATMATRLARHAGWRWRLAEELTTGLTEDAGPVLDRPVDTRPAPGWGGGAGGLMGGCDGCTARGHHIGHKAGVKER